MRLLSFAAIAVLATFSAQAIAADLPPGHPPLDAASRQATPPSHSGEVKEAIPAAGYVYLHVNGPEGDEWLAAPASDFKPGAKINWNDGMVMQNFTSKTLNRTFPQIRFVETVERSK